MKEWHLKTRRGTEIGNALARKARRWMGSVVWPMTAVDQWVVDALLLVG